MCRNFPEIPTRAAAALFSSQRNREKFLKKLPLPHVKSLPCGRMVYINCVAVRLRHHRSKDRRQTISSGDLSTLRRCWPPRPVKNMSEAVIFHREAPFGYFSVTKSDGKRCPQTAELLEIAFCTFPVVSGQKYERKNLCSTKTYLQKNFKI